MDTVKNLATLGMGILPRVHQAYLNWEMSLVTHKMGVGRGTWDISVG